MIEQSDNLGLNLQKGFRNHLCECLKDKEKQQFLKAICDKVKPSSAYGPHLETWKEAMRAIGATLYEAKLQTRLLIGTGGPSPTENGLSVNHTFGVPVVPGSTIKGAVRAKLMEVFGESDDAHANNLRTNSVLGSTEHMSSVTFFDAMPALKNNESIVALEIMTPHYQDYMTGKEEKPLDSSNPIPVSLVAVKSGTTFWFAVLYPNREWEEKMRPLLEATLEGGLGSKVNQGYGRFKLVNPQASKAVSNAPDVGEWEELSDGQHEIVAVIVSSNRTSRTAVAKGRTFTISDCRAGSLLEGSKVKFTVPIAGKKSDYNLHYSKVREVRE
jgi:CRISPR type III-B/RAMP module RAMP protein Cmr6